MTDGSVTEYDPRRPRIPVQLAAEIDAVRGKVSFNRWVVSRLADSLGVDLAQVVRAAAPKKPPRPKAATKKSLPASETRKSEPKTMRPAISSAKAGMFSKDEAMTRVKEKHATRRRQLSQRRDNGGTAT